MRAHIAGAALIACVGLASAAHAQNAIVPDSRQTSSASIDLPIPMPAETSTRSGSKARTVGSTSSEKAAAYSASPAPARSGMFSVVSSLVPGPPVPG